MMLLAVADDGAWLPKWGWSIYSAIVAPRFVASVSGFFIGLLIARAEILERLSTILLQIPSWAVTSTVGVLIIAGIVLALNPALLGTLQSLKVGGLEATFAARGSSVRESEIRLDDVAQKLTLDDYIGFREAFIKPDSPRRKIAEWYLEATHQQAQIAILKTGRMTILDEVFGNFVDPIVLALQCLRENDALEAAKRQESLPRLATRWEHFLLQLNKQSPTDEEWNEFLKDVKEQSINFVTYALTVGKGCEHYRDIVKPDAAALLASGKKIRDAYRRSLQSRPASEHKIHALTAMEPYVVGLAGDLVAFVFGQKEKADFLDQIAEHFPQNDDLLQPGIINLFFQIIDAKIQSGVSWPMDELTEQLDYALHGADTFIATSLEHEQNDCDKKIAKEIVKTYEIVAFRILVENLALYNQRALRSEPLSNFHLRRWMAMLSRLLAISHARDKTIGPVEGIDATSLDSDAIRRWPKFNIEARYLIDANIGIALGLVLHDPGQEQSSASECASARYYLAKAEENLDALFVGEEVNHAEKGRLEQFIKVVGYRVGAHCLQRS